MMKLATKTRTVAIVNQTCFFWESYKALSPFSATCGLWAASALSMSEAVSPASDISLFPTLLRLGRDRLGRPLNSSSFVNVDAPAKWDIAAVAASIHAGFEAGLKETNIDLLWPRVERNRALVARDDTRRSTQTRLLNVQGFPHALTRVHAMRNTLLLSGRRSRATMSLLLIIMMLRLCDESMTPRRPADGEFSSQNCV